MDRLGSFQGLRDRLYRMVAVIGRLPSVGITLRLYSFERSRCEFECCPATRSYSRCFEKMGLDPPDVRVELRSRRESYGKLERESTASFRSPRFGLLELAYGLRARVVEELLSGLNNAKGVAA